MLIEKLENDPKIHVLILASILFFLLIVIFYPYNIFHLTDLFILLICFFFIYELFIVGIYYYYLQSSYRNRLFSPVLTNHKIYGYSFPDNFNSKKYKKLLFEKYLFKSNNISLNLVKNIDDRVSLIINNGYRGKKIDSQKYKIFCCGGSTTACDSCNDDETWPYLLEKKLNVGGYDYQVVNSGTQGWYSYQDLLRIKHEIINHNPKAIILHQGWNEEFEYSSQNLGRDWKARTVRDYIAANVIYTKQKQTSALNHLCSILLIKRIYYFYYKFKKRMSFSNKYRWNVLKSNEYLDAWFDVLIDVVNIAKKNNIAIYMINPPCLVDIHDDNMNRRIYIENSRLNKWFANYQAISSERISNFLAKVNLYIPVINCKESFRKYSGIDRLDYFIDEIHLSPIGNEALSDCVYSFLINDKCFINLLKGNKCDQNVDINNFSFIKHNASANSSSINKLIDKNIKEIINIKPSSKDEIPTDRYTTF